MTIICPRIISERSLQRKETRSAMSSGCTILPAGVVCHDGWGNPLSEVYNFKASVSTAETKAIKIVFDKRAYQIPISSNKSMIGHLACAAGAAEAVAAVMTVKNGTIPPTINYETPDPDCDLDYVPNKARQQPVKTCLSNSFGMGGQNCCLIIKRFS